MYSIFVIYFALGAAVAVSISVFLYDISRNDLNEEEEYDQGQTINSLEDRIASPESTIPVTIEENPFQQILAERIEAINCEKDFSEPLPLQSEKRESEILMNEIVMPEASEQEEKIEESRADINSRHHEIYAAYDAGKSVEEIAQSCQRAQGEVELILRLRNYT